MEIIPAVDIKGGQCVRLYQGDYERETVFSDDPLEVALKWQAKGAPRLHIVDLDGARAGELCNLGIISEIARAMLIPVQLGGGIRQLETIEAVLKQGVERVVLGTAAVENAVLVKEACHRFPDSIVVSVDAQEGQIATHGWRKTTELTALSFIRAMMKLGVKRFIYTDISRDGTLTEPNFDAISEVIDATRAPVIAAGGISSINHLKMLQKLGAEGAIVGKALYTGNIDLKQAIATLSRMG
ncbi:MAG TPA: 1-(5-phosphoribosyl)-5-[(5-phosphoribosylamino)methylideneamino]imidazole-4-carboxamide isomerase [Dehalococcoidia bacterium]|nr:1-(5-phosphoribosyl)-5-[(5-phosphoribosylamino)methylideneamino]imidazole-4-carboxamide isomerase [Dehalococcoidia bacterium]